MVDIHSYPDAATARRMAGEALNEALTQHGQKPILFLFSGGSSQALLEWLKPELFDARVTIGVVDERFTEDPKVNNFSQLKQTNFYKSIMTRGILCLETAPIPKETVEEMGKRYDEDLKDWRMSHADGVVISILGIGPDGHIAGIMPYPDDQRSFEFQFEDADVWAVGYDAGWRNTHPLRVTATLPFLRKIDMAVAYAVGAEKQKALTSALAPGGSLYHTPARVVHEMPHCLLYTDQPVGRVNV